MDVVASQKGIAFQIEANGSVSNFGPDSPHNSVYLKVELRTLYGGLHV